MLKIDTRLDEGIIVVSPNGALNTRDIASLKDKLGAMISDNKKLRGLLIHAKRFPGWSDFGAFVSHIRFIKDQMKSIDRVAIVSDGVVLRTVPKLASPFVTTKIRIFGFDDSDAALSWLLTG